MGQIREFFRSDSVHLARYVLNLIWKIPGFVQFGVNLAHFGSKFGHPSLWISPLVLTGPPINTTNQLQSVHLRTAPYYNYSVCHGHFQIAIEVYLGTMALRPKMYQILPFNIVLIRFGYVTIVRCHSTVLSVVFFFSIVVFFFIVSPFPGFL